MDHGVSAAGNHDVGVAASNDVHGFTDRLGAGSAGGQAVVGGAADSELPGDVAHGHVRLLADLAPPAQDLEGLLGPAGQVELIALRIKGDHVHRGIRVKVQDPFAGAEIDPHPARVQIGVARQARLIPRLAGGPQGELRVGRRGLVQRRVVRVLAVVIIADLRREGRGKRARVEPVDGCHTRLALDQL